MRALVVEDELHNYRSLKKQLEEIWEGTEVLPPVTTVTGLREALLHQDETDVIFTDIRLDDGLCFEALCESSVEVPLIFTTAYDEYALQAFRAGGVDYLLKPVSEEDLRQVLKKIQRMQFNPANLTALLCSLGVSVPAHASRLLVNRYNGTQIVRVEEFSHFLFSDRSVKGFFRNGAECVLQEKTLDNLSARLDSNMFFRANRQCIVNIDAIARIYPSFHQSGEIELKEQPHLRIKVSKETLARIKKIIRGM